MIAAMKTTTDKRDLRVRERKGAMIRCAVADGWGRAVSVRLRAQLAGLARLLRAGLNWAG